MKSEMEILQILVRIKRKRLIMQLNTLQHLLLWSWYKHWILESEEIRNKLISVITSNMSKEDFGKKLAEVVPSNYYPRKYKGSKQRRCDFSGLIMEFFNITLHEDLPFEIRNTAYGVGLYARKRLDVEKDTTLFGLFYQVNEDIWKVLRQRNYPSLYNEGSVYGIMYGPLCLINHSCDINVGFSSLRKDVWLNYRGIHMKGIKVFAKDSQILIRYTTIKAELGFNCGCRKCKFRD